MKKNSFKYWFAHWCSYQLTALKYGCWKFRFLFHDCIKPYLGLFLSYEQVRKIHRKYSQHHPEHGGKDYLGMIIDWECSPLTKSKEKPEDNNGAWWVMQNIHPYLTQHLQPLLEKYKIPQK